MPEKLRPVLRLLALLLILMGSLGNTAHCSALHSADAQFADPQTFTLKRATIAKVPQLDGYDKNASKSPDYLTELRVDGFFCWPVNKLPVKVYFQPAVQVPGYKKRFSDCLSSCFDEWADASKGKISWQRVTEPAMADVVVRWTSAVTERAEGTEAGRTKTFASFNTATNCGTIHGAEMLLLTRLAEREFSADEVRRAYLHEVGHAFGIAGHSCNPNDIMYYAVTEHANPHLDDRDRATINRLYRNLSVHS